MDEDMYDEFGNYIGPDIHGQSSDSSSEDEGRNRAHSSQDEDSVSHLLHIFSESKLLIKISF